MHTTTPYPAAIVAWVEELVQLLTRHVAVERGADLATHEQGVLAAWGVIRGRLLTAVVTTATTSLQPGGVPQRTRCPRCGAPGRPPRRARAPSRRCVARSGGGGRGMSAPAGAGVPAGARPIRPWAWTATSG